LGFRPEPDIQLLMRAKLLKPLGNPARNGVKYFSTCQVLELSRDTDWLHKATASLQKFWKQKNHAKTSSPSALVSREIEQV
jgi:hypothetical protein